MINREASLRNEPNEDDELPPQEEQLFGIGPGYREGEDTIRYLGEETPEPAETVTYAEPEKPKPLAEMTADEMIEVALMDRLPPDIHGFYDPKRDEFMRKGFHWTPYSELEVTAAIGDDKFDNPPLVAYILGAQERGGRAAVKKVLDSIDQARARSVLDIELLREIQDARTGEFNPKGARFNPVILSVLAKAVYARNSFNRFEWPNHYLSTKKVVRPNPRVDRQLQAITNRLSRLPDDQLEHLCQKTLIHQAARLDFFAKQMDAVQAHADTDDLVAAARTHV